MKTLLITVFSISCMITLYYKNKDLKEIIGLQDKEIHLQDSLINVIQESNRKYIDVALSCECKR